LRASEILKSHALCQTRTAFHFCRSTEGRNLLVAVWTHLQASELSASGLCPVEMLVLRKTKRNILHKN
jgi:hypothetical protein